MRTYGLRWVLTLLLLGTTACGSGSGGGGPGAAGATITGLVRNLAGVPVPTVPIVVVGHAPVLTDASGQFQVAGVSLPYTLILIEELGARARVFAGLTRLDPSFRIRFEMNHWSATLSGSTSGGLGFPLPPNYSTGASFGTSTEPSIGSISIDSVTGDWSLPTLNWDGPADTTVRFFALQAHSNPAGLVDDFTGVAALDAPIRHGETRSGYDISLQPVVTALCSGTVNAPAGYAHNGKFLLLEHANGNTIPLPPDTGPLDAFSLATMDTPDVSTSLIVGLLAPGGGGVAVVQRDLPVPAVGLSVDVPLEMLLVSPSNGATSVWHETPFAVSSDPGPLFNFTWRPQGVGPEIELFTEDPDATIPDLAEYGLPLPSGATYEWTCAEFGPAFSIDGYTADGLAEPYFAASGYQQLPPVWTFTTGP